jgi:hypothetical protein
MTSLKIREKLYKWRYPKSSKSLDPLDRASIETTMVTWGSPILREAPMAAQWPKLLATASAAARNKLSGMLLAWQHTAPKDMPGKM